MDAYTSSLLLGALLAIGWYVKRLGFTYMVVHYRWIFLLLFVMPASLVYNAFLFVRSYIVFTFATAPSKHKQKVEGVQRQVKQWIADGRQPGQMCTARPGWQTVSVLQAKYKETMKKISINLVDILHLDVERRVVRVEPLCTMGQISALITPLGWSLPVTPEFEDLTVGGMVNGFGIETSSHLHGLFQHFVTKIELVMADGSVKTCSADENPDLFYSVPMSHGTLGFLVSAELKIVPIKPYVKLQYYPIRGFEEMCRKFEAESRDTTNDFVECLVFTRDSGVVMAGKLTNQVQPGKVNSIGNYYKPWFYTHVRSFLESGVEAACEYIPLRHYYHRHSKCYFWEMAEVITFGNHPLFRYLLGWTQPLKISFMKLATIKQTRELRDKLHMDQDFLIPIASLQDSLKYFDDEVKIYPIWLCPFRLPHQPGFMHPPTPDSDQLYVDIGLYGSPPPEMGYDAVNTTRRLEAFVRSVNGYQMLYADCYQTRDEFREMFDHSLYDKVKKDVDSEQAFPEVYDKVKKSVRF